MLLIGCSDGEKNDPVPQPSDVPLTCQMLTVNGLSGTSQYKEVSRDPVIELFFSTVVDHSTVSQAIKLTDKDNRPITLTFSYGKNDSLLVLRPTGLLDWLSKYTLTVSSDLRSQSGYSLAMPVSISLITALDSTDKYSIVADEELLTLVQKQTFRYFWDFGHPVSGMARERSTSGDVVTTGGTGFGIMAMLVAVERGFIARAEAADRVLTIARFLKNDCTSYHGAFAHWINGATGKTQPFSEKDNGADLVETSFLFQGLLTARQYFTENHATESELRSLISELWEAVEWNWFCRDNEDVLYWHWSPDYGWAMNHQIRGWNECLITYVMAASSPTYPIDKKVYDQGWARNGAMKNGGIYYGYTLPLGEAYGGPLFFTHYSFLGLNPKGLKDKYADYWEQNASHASMNYEYCRRNPSGNYGYSNDCWGLTASDGNGGYSAHSPTNDKGVIAPTAALSSMPYTPEESMVALRFFYYKLGDKLWKDYGFVDAFNLTAKWYDSQFLAIDQGPIIVMIENYRTGLLWNLFMDCPEIQAGLSKLEFEYSNCNL
ncbi:glucoamylase family protein [Parabacteroides sp. PF5-9]|uniref:glucoamylase family protein n=1 Tax=Parabacteroides sp. PF5-9 TaxID=1742404 RepID=UPI00247356F3|nr:glucoamylase family protein [Parabacteroides sp. PF5-9]